MILVFDIGRTNKKFILFDQNYNVITEKSEVFPDIEDEDGDRCEDLPAITKWLKNTLHELLKNNYPVKAINFSAHGASFVHINSKGEFVTPLYDYLKPIDKLTRDQFYNLFGGEKSFSLSTASPAFDMLNSGMQLFWLKRCKPDFFKEVQTSLLLPQYANYVFTGERHADITSIGCHTGLWDFKNKRYHHWIKEQSLDGLLPNPENPENYDEIKINEKRILVGIGLHDNSAALLSFEHASSYPFVLLSTGTWNISMNPYLERKLTKEDFERDCLYYLLSLDKKVASSRLFLGNEFQHQTKRLARVFGKQESDYQKIEPDLKLFNKVIAAQSRTTTFFPETMKGTGPLPHLKADAPDFSSFESYEEAYHKLVLDMAYLQKISLSLISDDTRRLYVSGGFVYNHFFLETLLAFLPGWEIFSAENKRASALGAALVLGKAIKTRTNPSEIAEVAPFKSQINIDTSGYKDFFQPHHNLNAKTINPWVH